MIVMIMKRKKPTYQNHRTKFHSTCTFPILPFSSSSEKSIHDITGLESMACSFSFCACFCNFNLANSGRLIGTFGDCPGGEIGKVEELDELELMNEWMGGMGWDGMGDEKREEEDDGQGSWEGCEMN